MRMLLALVLCLAYTPHLYATTWYVAPPGRGSGGNGTLSTPFRAITSAWGVLKPGDTLILLPGDYRVILDIPRHVAGKSWDVPIVIDGQGKARFLGQAQAIFINGGYHNLRDLANAVGADTPDKLNAVPYLGGRVQEHLIIRGVAIDGIESQATNSSAITVTNGARRIRFEDIHAYGWPGGGVNSGTHTISAYSADWDGSSPYGRKYHLDVTFSHCRIGPPANVGIMVYFSAQRIYVEDSVFEGTWGAGCNSATESLFLRNTFKNGRVGGNCTNTAWFGNTFINALWEQRGNTALVMHNTFVRAPLAHTFTDHQPRHDGNAFIGNVYDGIGTLFQGTHVSQVRHNLLNQGVVDPQTGVVRDAGRVGQPVPRLTQADVLAVGGVNPAETWSYWQEAYQRWQAEGGHSHYGAVAVSGVPPPVALPAPQRLRLGVP